MLPSSDDVPSLAVCRSTLGNFDGGQVGTEVTRELVDRETFAIRSLPVCGQLGNHTRLKGRTYLDVDVGRGPGGRVITLLSLSNGGFVKGGNRSDRDKWVGGGEARTSEDGDQLGNHGEGGDPL